MRTHQLRRIPRGGAKGFRPRAMHSVHANAKCGNSSHCNCRRGLQTHGGLTPAALVNVRLSIGNGTLCSARTSCSESGRRKPTVENVRDCTGVGEPRRANARRSCERAFVHRKNRFFDGRRSHRNTRAGGVSPPWFRKRAYKRVSSTLRTTFARPHPRRADAWHCSSSVR